MFSVGKKLRAGKFDLALVLPNSPRSALEVWLAGIPQRIGYARPWRNCFLTQAVAPRAGRGENAEAVRGRNPTSLISRRAVSRSTFEPATFNLQPRHQIHEYLHLAAALGANPEPLPPQLFVDAGRN